MSKKPNTVKVFKDQEENKHEAQGRKFVYFSRAILTFGNRKALGKVLLDKETGGKNQIDGCDATEICFVLPVGIFRIDS